MSIFAVFLIYAVASALAVVLAWPIIFWLRRRGGRQPQPAAPLGLSTRLTVLQALPGLVFVAVLAAVFSAEFWAPGSWFGQRIAGWEGKFWFFVFVFVCLGALQVGMAGLRRRKPGTPKP